jgi:hypothetical protein
MKSEIRVLGIDDAPFSFKSVETLVVGVVMRGKSYVEGILSTKVKVDGTDSTAKLIEMINSTRHKQQLRAILVDGVALGGFNVLDIDELAAETNLPVLTITRDKPDLESIENALRKHFTDWKARLELMSRGEIQKIETSHKPIWIKHSGVELSKAKETIQLTTLRGALPEPIRLAHLIASGITKGESYGNA